jgi:DMSO/TMAO reductase YedYZ molybdopterin-dependent catalytic subunit
MRLPGSVQTLDAVMKRLLAVVVVLLVGMIACAPQPVPTDTAVPTVATASSLGPAPCVLTPVVAPTLPAEVPGYAQLDESSGLHVTGEIQVVDLPSYRLKVTGKVDRPLVLTYDDLRCMPKKVVLCTLVCPGFFEDTGNWGGASLKQVLDQAGIEQGATTLKLVSVDGYTSTVPVSAALADDSLLAYEWEGQPVPVLHGFPVRAVFPALDGNTWAKWLVGIEVN